VRKLLGASLVAALLLSVQPASASTATIAVQNMAFSQRFVTVPLGATVTWSFRDSVPHSTTSNQNFWNSGAVGPGRSYTTTFPSAGVFAYHCALHPTMTGQVSLRPVLIGAPRHWTVVWSTAPGGPHRAFEVQWRYASSTRWLTIAHHSRTPRLGFPVVASGKFVIRARTENPVNGLASGWSQIVFTQ
jgi:plastocyanin